MKNLSMYLLSEPSPSDKTLSEPSPSGKTQFLGSYSFICAVKKWGRFNPAIPRDIFIIQNWERFKNIIIYNFMSS